MYSETFSSVCSSDPECKAEWHQAATDLQDKLWDLIEKRKDDAEQERTSLMNNRWLDDHVAFATNYYLVMMQLEMDRHAGTLNLLLDYHRDLEQKVNCRRPV